MSISKEVKLNDIQANEANNFTTLDALVKQMCFCKLRTYCLDKTSPECLKHHNIYAEFMQNKHSA